MPCGILTPSITKHLASTFTGANSLRFEPYTDWFPVIGLDVLKAILKLRGVTNQFQGQLAFQTAVCRTDNPDAWATLDQMTSSDRCTGVLNVTSALAGKFYVRFGIGFNISSGSTNSQADVTLQLSYDACGLVAGGVTLQALAPDTSNYFAPVTGWLQAIDAVKVLAAILVSGALNNFQCRLTYRTATTDTGVVTDNWAVVNLEAGWHAGNGEFNTGTLTLPTGVGQTGRIDDKMWIQFGLQFSVSSGTAGQATVSVATAVRA